MIPLLIATLQLSGLVGATALAALILNKLLKQFVYSEPRDAHLAPLAPDVSLIEAVAGISGLDGPHFLYEIFQKLGRSSDDEKAAADTPWVMRMPLPMFAPLAYHRLTYDLTVIGDANFALDVMIDPTTLKAPGYRDFDQLCHGQKSMFSTESTEWKNRRKAVAGCFSQSHLDRIQSICQTQLNQWIDDVLEPCAEDGKAFNIGEEMIYLTLRIVCESVLDDEDHIIDDEDLKLFKHHLQIAATEFIFMDQFHQFMPWLFPAVWKAKRSSKYLQQFSLRLIDNYRAKHKAYYDEMNSIGGLSSSHRSVSTATKVNVPKDTIIRRIMENATYADDLGRAADITLLLIAAHDTTAYSISHTLMHTTRSNPKELQTFRDKAKQIVANTTSPSPSPQSTDKSKLRQLHSIDELQWMIQEGMRLSPVIAMGVPRWIGKDWMYTIGEDTDKDKSSNDSSTGNNVSRPIKQRTFFLRKGSIALLPFFPSFRNPKYFEDPDEYIPSRWDSNNNKKNKSTTVPTQLSSFANGPRGCLGKYMAKVEMETVLATLLSKYDFEIENEGHLQFSLTLQPIGAQLIPRKIGA